MNIPILLFVKKNGVHSELAHCSGLTSSQLSTILISVGERKKLRQKTIDKFEQIARGYAKIQGIPYYPDLINKLFNL